MQEKLKEQYTKNLQFFYDIANILDFIGLEEMLEVAHKADSVGSILDPSLYRQKVKALQQDIRLMEAYRVVINALREIKQGEGMLIEGDLSIDFINEEIFRAWGLKVGKDAETNKD